MPDKKQSTKNSKNTKSTKTTKNSHKQVKDAEASAEQVVREEVYSGEERAKKRKRCCCESEHTKEPKRSRSSCGCNSSTDNPSEPKKNAKAHKCAGKAPAKSVSTKGGNRPKQKGYKMIDPSDESADGSKS